MGETDGRPSRDDLYQDASTTFGAALTRLVAAYEPDPEKRRDLLQDIHLGLWQSFARFDGRCSLRTWVYRVAHNIATSVVIRRRAATPSFVALEDIGEPATQVDGERDLDERRTLDRLLTLVQTLKPLDRQVIVLYLEGESAATIAEVTGLTSGNAATKLHRIRRLLVERFRKGACYGD
jgi:RNA polymerase sigma-70 factor (ECF subfamily)